MPITTPRMARSPPVRPSPIVRTASVGMAIAGSCVVGSMTRSGPQHDPRGRRRRARAGRAPPGRPSRRRAGRARPHGLRPLAERVVVDGGAERDDVEQRCRRTSGSTPSAGSARRGCTPGPPARPRRSARTIRRARRGRTSTARRPSHVAPLGDLRRVAHRRAARRRARCCRRRRGGRRRAARGGHAVEPVGLRRRREDAERRSGRSVRRRRSAWRTDHATLHVTGRHRVVDRDRDRASVGAQLGTPDVGLGPRVAVARDR